MLASVSPDFFPVLAKYFDDNELWKKVKINFLSKLILYFSIFFIWTNHLFHWFTQVKWFKRWTKGVEKYNCLPGKIYWPMKSGWWNLSQLFVSVIIVITYFNLK